MNQTVIRAYHDAFDNMDEEGIKHQETSAYQRYLQLTGNRLKKHKKQTQWVFPYNLEKIMGVLE